VSANQDTVRKMIAAFNADDQDGLRTTLHPDISVRRPLPDLGIATAHSDMTSYHGVDEVLPALSGLIAATGGIRVDLRHLEDAGKDAVLFEFVAGMGPEETRTTWLGWSLFCFREGRIVSTETFATEAEARDAISKTV
jgi:ketosteroid isomerase-like protein